MGALAHPTCELVQRGLVDDCAGTLADVLPDLTKRTGARRRRPPTTTVPAVLAGTVERIDDLGQRDFRCRSGELVPPARPTPAGDESGAPHSAEQLVEVGLGDLL